jgi:hypothetical protein
MPVIIAIVQERFADRPGVFHELDRRGRALESEREDPVIVRRRDPELAIALLLEAAPAPGVTARSLS